MWGGAGARSVHGGPDSTLRARHARGRTLNIQAISVTLDVSRLSGWLNADADLNIRPMFVTLDVSRLSGWLNADAP